MTSFKKPRPPLNPFLVPLTAEQHAALSNPPDMALIALKEGHATRKDLWNLWYRGRVTLHIAERHHKDVVDAIRPIVDNLEALFLDAHANPQKEIHVTLEDRLDIESLLEVANEIQQETNRGHQAPHYREQRDYCLKAVAAVQVNHQPAN